MQAAVLVHGIAETQPFVEGNKRTALTAMRAFLLLNGYTVTVSQQERMEWMLSLAEGAARRRWPSASAPAVNRPLAVERAGAPAESRSAEHCTDGLVDVPA